MNFIAQVEEHLRDLGAEARKNHPGVKEASERAILQLRTLQNAYVTAVRKATQTGGTHPTTKLFRSQDILRPFLLATNYPNASPKLLQISLSAMSLLIEGNAICPGDGIHMVRVWTIQANGCASALKRTTGKTASSRTSGTPGTGTSSSSASASSSWFGGMLSSTSMSTDVSSSSGQGGGGGSHHTRTKESEKLALELLSCLIQLLELRNDDLPVTDEQWASSVALCCILLHVEKSTLVPQAAKSTLHQVLGLLFEDYSDISVETWKDLLALAAPENSSRQSIVALKGAFSHSATAILTQTTSTSTTTNGPMPPSQQECLELLYMILSQDSARKWLTQSDALLHPAFELTTAHVLNQQESLELLWRSCQLAKVLLMIRCDNDLIVALVQGIVAATEACRQNHDFEDGYVYSGNNVCGGQGDSAATTTAKRKKIATLIPDSILWKAGLALGTLFSVLPHLQTDISVVAEAISDFCTVGASCRDHMMQLVECAAAKNNDEPDVLVRVEPTMFHDVEEAIKAGNNGAGGDIGSVGSTKTAGACRMGETLWVAFHCVLQLSKNTRSVSDEMEGCFAPLLAVFQHYLKRFQGCSLIVRCTLEGYCYLADVAIPAGSGGPLLRQALLASLCKLSLPSWGKHDPSSQLGDHHVESLLCLLKIIHKHYDSILSDWRMILWTFQELSVLSISSSLLSDEGYSKALAVCSTFSRIAPLTTCLSPESLTCVIDALADVSISCLENADILTEVESISRAAENARPRVDGADTQKHHKRASTNTSIGSDVVEQRPRDSMSGRLMNFAGRTLLGSHQSQGAGGDSVVPLPVVEERTRNLYFDPYRREFLDRLLSSKQTIRTDAIGKLPFSLATLTDVALANTYRYKVCGTSISNHFCSLAVASPDLRDYSMDVLAMLIASQLSGESTIPSEISGPGRVSIERPMKNQFLVVEAVLADDYTAQFSEDERGASDKRMSQADLIAPLCDTIRTAESVELCEAGISAINTILEGAGHNMADDVWTVLIVAISSLSGNASKVDMNGIDRSGNEWASCCMQAFRSLKLIVEEFLDQFPPMTDSPLAPRRALLDCCSSFGSSRHDVNISLTAIGLLWSIADLDSHSWSIDRALTELVFLCSDDRTEVRNCAVNTLFSCIVGRGQDFTSEQWDVCIMRTIFGVYGDVLVRGTSGETEANGGLAETPSGEAKKNRNSSDRYRVSVHHSRDSAGKQWATTQVLVLQGLSRVLRNFFPQLLETMDSSSDGDCDDLDHDPVWFKSAWARILEVSLDAAMQPTSRETLELRIAGVNLLVQCCQFTCRAGMQAAIAPAVIGTNMEVVNGALRHVDESPKTISKTDSKECTAEIDEWRKCFFLAAFDALDVFRGFIESEARDDSERVNLSRIEGTQIQVLHKLTLGLEKLYDGCKDDEFAPWRSPSFQRRSLELDWRSETRHDDLEGRFVRLVATVVTSAKGDPTAQFLTQAQRAALELLRQMSKQSSDEAIRILAVLGGHSFYCATRKDSDDDSTLDDNSIGALGSELLSREAARAVTEELSGGTILDETKVQVLYRVLSTLVAEMDVEIKNKENGKRRPHCRNSYALLVPVVTSGLESAARLDNMSKSQDDNSDAEASSSEDSAWLEPLWRTVVVTLTHLLTPVRTTSHGLYIPRSSSLVDISSAIVSNIPSKEKENAFEIFSCAVRSSVDVLQSQYAITTDESKTSDVRRRAKARGEETLRLLDACFDGLCKLQPTNPSLRELTKSLLRDALPSASSKDATSSQRQLHTDVAVAVCRVIARNTEVGRLVIASFSLLSQLISVDDEGLREEASGILGQVDVGRILEEATLRYEAAEERAQQSEEHIQELIDEIEDLREENETLHQQILVYSTSSVLS